MSELLKDGIYFGLDMDEYHADPALGSSGIKLLRQSGLSYWVNSPHNPNFAEKQAVKKAKDAKKATTLGSFVHDKILHQGKPYIKKPLGMSFSTKAGIAWRSQVPEGVEIIDGELHGDAVDIFDAMKRHDLMKDFTGGAAEMSIFWTTKSGHRCKIRPDYTRPNCGIDLKTYANERRKTLETTIAHAVANESYHISAYWYRLGLEVFREMCRKQGSAAVVYGNAPEGFIQATADYEGSFPYWFYFLETGGVPNITIRKFEPFDEKSGQVNEYYQAAKNGVNDATDLYARMIEKYGFSQPWDNEVEHRSFEDRDFVAAPYITRG